MEANLCCEVSNRIKNTFKRKKELMALPLTSTKSLTKSRRSCNHICGHFHAFVVPTVSRGVTWYVWWHRRRQLRVVDVLQVSDKSDQRDYSWDIERMKSAFYAPARGQINVLKVKGRVSFDPVQQGLAQYLKAPNPNRSLTRPEDRFEVRPLGNRTSVVVFCDAHFCFDLEELQVEAEPERMGMGMSSSGRQVIISSYKSLVGFKLVFQCAPVILRDSITLPDGRCRRVTTWNTVRDPISVIP